MKIIIRANGGTKIGMGHIMRCTVLADQLRTFATVVFVCEAKDEFKPGVDFLVSKNYQVVIVDSDKLLEKLCSMTADVLITDSYKVDENYFDALKDKFPVTGYIDDTNLYRFNVDFLLNQNIYAPDLGYDTPETTTKLLGSDYLLLRDEFHNIPERQTPSELKHLLITLGGSDDNNLTGELIRQVTELHPELTLHIVIGPSFIHSSDLDKLASNAVLLYTKPKMSNLMQKVDMAISACGSTIYELASCGVPTLGIVIANNQRNIAEKMHEMDLLKFAHNVKDVAKMISLYNYQVRYNMSRKAQRTFHNNGAVNAADQIKKLIYTHSVFGDSGNKEE